jgi:hypothetical protein
MIGVDSVACAVGVSAVSNDTLVKDVEWLGVENQVAALAEANTQADLGTLYFSLISCERLGTVGLPCARSITHASAETWWRGTITIPDARIELTHAI